MAERENEQTASKGYVTAPSPTSWVEIDLSALKHNLSEVRSFVGPSVKVMAVVKADAYGHGAVMAARAFAEAGADCLGVTTLEEALELREGGISIPILVFSPLLPDQVEPALANDLEQTVGDPASANSISETASKLGRQARVHVKVDTGMGRLGAAAGDCPDFVYRLLNLKGIEVAGIYTHFANAGAKNLSHAKRQNARFGRLIRLLESKDMPVGLRHAANSAATLNLPDSHYDMVRVGTILYGQYPTPNIRKKLDLQDTWTLKTRIVALRRLPKGAKVGYGSEFRTTRPTLAAVLPIEYADGFTLMPESAARRAYSPLRTILGGSGSPYVTVRGQRAPVIGRVSMQMCSVDVTDIREVQVDDEAVIPARRTTTSSRIRRVYAGG
jgi:alanine racemase